VTNLDNAVKEATSEIATINHSLNKLDDQITKLDNLSDHMNSLIEWLHQSKGPLSSKQPSQQESIDSSHSMAFRSNPLTHDLCLPKFEVNKFDGSDPTSRVTQMEHYFSLHGIIDYLIKIRVGAPYLDPK